VETVSDKVVRHWPIYPCENDRWGMSPSTWKFGGYWPIPCKTPIFNLYSLVAPQL